MSTSVLEIKGIGPAAAAILAENGITCAEDLAATTVLQIAAIKGFNEIRATQVLADAQALIATDGTKDEIKIKGKKKSKVAKKIKAEKKAKPEKSTAEKKKKSKNTAAKKAKDEKKAKKVKNSDKPEKKEKKNKEKKNKKGK
jgi:hypothetical protein